ncbi:MULTISPECIES: acyl-CoA dehydrogenase family protein [Salipiger]|jgi:acyl-CoA dehydrogenase|uniref:Acyl-CoA dehydrogenase, N-terminal domain n=2 Tax=Salipiger TaxID=263377 RepID=A0A1G7JKL4_9RHOB|nr:MULTISPECIES: acyl-CoA dehydrogenase family protein [Salipiger]EIE51025.1 acyl-CoA dehydrogenase domain-containing protein [Citreicella sp. 357]KAA8612202.1 acyl-CoA dehydrogenase [Salipiger aestuarii]KAB2541809.1 acyl-CoA dehydrogenase [Salipiger aestuarii]RAK18551.1 alkylation response protein AidB-like acyl-CoA dehydrogenase [Salipiger aestuarii]SDF25395.1 Acyl-CoA dehydrogenase, N-terminal domain [Salipiger thiooxidans]
MESMIHDMAERLFRDHIGHGLREGAAAGQCPEALWTRIEEAGLPMALVPEEAGGFGVPAAEALGLVRIAGAHGLPLPLAETLIANAVLARAGLTLPGGRLTIAEGAALRLDRRGAAIHASGPLTLVPFARWADRIVTIAALDGVDHVLSLPVKDLTVTPAQDLAGMPRDDAGVDLALTDADAAPLPRSLGGMRGLGALARSLATAGAMETILSMTVEYANDRVQFGRPIGKFQAIQHYLATMAGETAASRAAAEMAADSYDTPAFALTVAAAKSRSGEAAETVGALAHQVHGAIGYTQEHALHHFTKRIWSWRDEFGTELDWTRELGRAALSSPRDTFWHFITDSTAQGIPA